MKQTKTWEQITDILIKEINKNTYKKDEKMPSENTMAVRFDVSRTEIRRVYNRLKELGYIYSLQGCGSFFSGHREPVKLILNSSMSFSEKMKELGIPYESRNICCKKIKYNHLIYETLGASPDDDVYKITRLRIINHEPAAMHTSYLCARHFPTLAVQGSSITSIFNYIKSMGYESLSDDTCQMVIAPLSKKERELLKVSGYESGMILTGTCIDKNSKTVLETSRTVYRCDKFVFTF